MDILIVIFLIITVILLLVFPNIDQNHSGNFVRTKRLGNAIENPILELNGYPTLKTSELFELPSTSGIYFFLIENTVVYVGETNSLKRRLTEDDHHVLIKLRHNPKLRIKYKSASPNKRLRLREEINLIKKYRPAMNLKDLVM